MATKKAAPKKGTKENPVTTEELENLNELPVKPIEIVIGELKDGVCNYTYEVKTGASTGDQHDVKGSGLATPDLVDAFNNFNVHLAAIAEVFKHAGLEADNIEDFMDHELTLLFRVSKFQIIGNKGNESIKFKGTYYSSSAGGWLAINTHKIVMDQYSSYKHFEHLLEMADNVRNEIELYRGGKCDAPEIEEPKEKFKQTQIFDNVGQDGQEDHSDAEFDNASV